MHNLADLILISVTTHSSPLNVCDFCSLMTKSGILLQQSFIWQDKACFMESDASKTQHWWAICLVDSFDLAKRKTLHTSFTIRKAHRHH